MVENYLFFRPIRMFLVIRQLQNAIYSVGFHLFLKDGIPLASLITKKAPENVPPELLYCLGTAGFNRQIKRG